MVHVSKYQKENLLQLMSRKWALGRDPYWTERDNCFTLNRREDRKERGVETYSLQNLNGSVWQKV